jgi:hypothetical protein
MTWIAYCPPGKKAFAELVLLLAGEVVDDIIESPHVNDIILANPNPEFPLPPFDFDFDYGFSNRFGYFDTPRMINFRPGIC